MARTLQGKKIAILAMDGVERVELEVAMDGVERVELEGPLANGDLLRADDDAVTFVAAAAGGRS